MRLFKPCLFGAWAFLNAGALAAPVDMPWPTGFPTGASLTAVAASSLSGYEAAADAASDSVQINDTRGNVLANLTRSRLTSLTPWMVLTSSLDGPVALAFSESGRLLFIGLHTTSASPDALPADAVLRYDTQSDSLTLFARVDLTPPDAAFTHIGMVHYAGKLYVGSAGTIRCYNAQRAVTAGSLVFTTSLGGFTPVGLTVDRTLNAILGAWNDQIWRSSIGASSLTFASLGSLGNVRDIAFSDHYGGSSNAGLYMLSATGAGAAVSFVPLTQARGTQAFSPTIYLSAPAPLNSTAATGEGSLLTGGQSNVTRIRDSSDSRLAFESWLTDEFAQVLKFGKGLVSPDGEPPGWVIDGDVIPAWNRFHPATPDAAGWTVLLCIMGDELSGTSGNLPVVRSILNRYAGLSPDGIKPDRSADGMFEHWINPATGFAEWTDGYATMSTMKIVHAAAKAAMFYQGDPQVRAAALAIIAGVHNWDSYVLENGIFWMLSQPAGGPNTGAISFCYNEGMLFANEAGAYGGSNAQDARAAWLDRSKWTGNNTSFVAGFPITGDGAGHYLPAFTSLYSLLLVQGFRDSADWQSQIRNIRLSSFSWTDDNAPRWNTVFSAGTNPDGYNADSFGGHPYNIATFTSLEAMAAGTGSGGGYVPAATGAYHAYRIGARQTFKTGASILYRRSSMQLGYTPDSAGMPDVALGALGLAELIKAGSVERVLAGDLLNLASCAADFNNDGLVDDADFVLFAQHYNDLLTPGAFRPGDLNGDSLCDDSDFVLFVGAYDALLCQ